MSALTKRLRRSVERAAKALEDCRVELVAVRREIQELEDFEAAHTPVVPPLKDDE